MEISRDESRGRLGFSLHSDGSDGAISGAVGCRPRRRERRCAVKSLAVDGKKSAADGKKSAAVGERRFSSRL